MQLHLEHLIPEPLQSRVEAGQPSDIWNVERTLAQGERVLLQAPSGKGKSTLIHILYGLRNDYSGNARWEGRPLKQLTDKDWAEMRSRMLSIVFQDLRLFNDLTIEENLILKQALTTSHTIAEAKAWTEELGLSGKWEQKAGTLSYGERQRVALVRSLLQPFRWLLLDEPFSHLDSDNIRKAATLIERQVMRQSAGMIVVDLEDNDWFSYTAKLLL